MSTIEKLFTIVNNLKVGKGKLSITKKKNYQKSKIYQLSNNNNNNNNNNDNNNNKQFNNHHCS